MEICSNCLRSKSGEHIFCPWCGFPARDIGLKQCNKGHIIYETFKSCLFCQQAGNLGKSFLDSKMQEGFPTETVQTPPLDKTVLEGDTGMEDKTVLETDVGSTVLEEEGLDKTVLEDYDDRTRLDVDTSDNKTRIREPAEQLPPLFAWVVFIDEEGLPLEDIRLTKGKNILGKGDEVDVRVADDFVSKLHALIYFEKEIFYISDLGSSNGTFLNGKKVMKEELKDGDHIRIGHQPMVFKRVMTKIS